MCVPLLSLKRAVRSISAGEFFETNEKMVLINDDQCDIADIVLDGWLFEKKLNHSSEYPTVEERKSNNKVIIFF